ncbi:MAG: hypothetical protein DWQ01_19480 [Planctomycetota bacterium]|nr:MAG: hypothetical protein DWQ01_19480 [Planctomycetota bacterium]
MNVRITTPFKTLSAVVLVSLALLWAQSLANAQGKTVVPKPGGGSLALSNLAHVDTVILSAMSTRHTIAGPALIDLDAQAAIDEPLWSAFGDSFFGDWTLTVQNLGELDVTITTPSGGRTLKPGESWASTAQDPAPNEDIRFSSSGTGNLKFAWVIRRVG